MSTGLDEFLQARPRLFRIANRIVGNPHEAEELVQDVWVRWQRTDRTVVADPQAFLSTTVSRLAINVVQSARRRHETAVAWLPDERAAGGVDPHQYAETQEAYAIAVHVMKERLSPAERATYVLREGFDCPYRQIGETLRIGAPNARQLVKRARDRMADLAV
ncbi:sigma-70 family RNA polymerase sigma factor [Kribbella sp. NPDC058693]|uniref:Sigma-70 family RNA polymerase sigma factor n=1 Tax=Kribbella jiaozuonensis TaxID=2575441 RepID=A0A4U3LLQ4_9ACTN|nr:sigma-70 family RNA polymerase sigma factor [Kribbella jiaozuonensis]TKK76452.1 sigma-70 family RNA polymerase sigma factor [Kribbella jiaozuonensis]